MSNTSGGEWGSPNPETTFAVPPGSEGLPIASAAPAPGETLEMTLVPSPEPSPAPDSEPLDLTGLWIGLAVALVIAVVAEAVALWRLAGKRRRAETVPAIRAAGPMEVGKVHAQGGRSSQQDCFSVSPEVLIPTHGLLAVVADGMGGLTDGDKVSQAAVATVMDEFCAAQGDPEQILLTLLKRANQTVNGLLGPEGQGKSGSTLVMGLIREGRFYALSVGDSRICLYRDGRLYQLNREHVFRHELSLRAVNGEGTFQEAQNHPKAAGLTSYLGMGQLKYVDIPAQPVRVRPGDKFILMSDGVYNALSEEELCRALAGAAEQSAREIESAIEAKAYRNQDNYTAVIISC